MIRTYLEWLVELPWYKETEDDLDIPHAREVLDADHYDLERSRTESSSTWRCERCNKARHLLASRPGVSRSAKGPILCFVGPPGVGKTSLGRSIARALGREFERISVGGVRDEAEIRGHRRTYVGAMPGTIVRALRDAGSRNPVFMIDEIDKMGADFRGDPVERDARGARSRPRTSPSATTTSTSPFDLSEVLFIATANTLDTIPIPLLDRMEVIQLAGYTADEKLHIAKRYLVPRQIDAERAGGAARSRSPTRRCEAIIEEYTREAGVRNLEREIGTVCRKVAREIAEGEARRGQGDRSPAKRARELLGRRRVFSESRRRTKRPGRGDRARLDAGRRRGALHRGDGDARVRAG